MKALLRTLTPGFDVETPYGSCLLVATNKAMVAGERVELPSKDYDSPVLTVEPTCQTIGQVGVSPNA